MTVIHRFYCSFVFGSFCDVVLSLSSLAEEETAGCFTLIVFLLLCMSLCFVSLSHCAAVWSVRIVPWVGLYSLTLSHCCVGLSVSLSHRVVRVVCSLCLFLTVPWVGLCSVSLSHFVVGRSVFCVSFSSCRGFICVLCLFFIVPWVNLCSVTLSQCAVRCSVSPFHSCVLCLFLIVPWVGLCFVSLSHCVCGWCVCSVSLSHCALGLSVFCVSFSLCSGLACVL